MQVEPQEKKKTPKGRAKKRITYTRRFVNVTMTGGKRKVRLSTSISHLTLFYHPVGARKICKEMIAPVGRCKNTKGRRATLGSKEHGDLVAKNPNLFRKIGLQIFLNALETILHILWRTTLLLILYPPRADESKPDVVADGAADHLPPGRTGEKKGRGEPTLPACYMSWGNTTCMRPQAPSSRWGGNGARCVAILVGCWFEPLRRVPSYARMWWRSFGVNLSLCTFLHAREIHSSLGIWQI